MSTSLPAAHSAFEPVRQQRVDSLNLDVQEFRHRETGAAHYHLASDSSENVFLVALRTVPEDSTGVAHILEHTALCGSERYPVRDPFFMMLRRSLNTFMNAFTSSDWTAYPFASQNRKDFNNLLDVYLDAVFFSRLDPLDFAQEGHRVEFEEANNPESDLVFKGVVFNEMKGAMSSVPSVLWGKLCEHLFPSTTYHYNSGGEPENIPDLSHEELVAFYRSHYHPSNAIFMTFGDISAAEHQATFEEKALSRFQRQDLRIQVPPETRLSAPLKVKDSYAFDEETDTSGKTHLIVGWMLGESSDLEQMLEAQLLTSVLLENSASPLQQALETTSLGQAPSPLCGLEDSMRELVFVCGIEGSEAEHADALEALVLEVITDVANNGISHERLQAVLHQLELHQREISGDSYPYGLQLIMQGLGCATHYSDPIAVLNLDPVIDSLRQRIEDPEYIKSLAQKLLLDNNHRVTLVMEPNKELSAEKLQREAQRLADIKAAMDEAQKQATVQLATDLSERQSQVDDESILPRVELSDVPAGLQELEFKEHNNGPLHVTTYSQGTNGLVYQQMIAALPALDSAQQSVLPLYTSFLTELGIGEGSYLDSQHRQSAEVGSINAFTSMRGEADNEQSITANFVLSSKALLRNAEDQARLMADTMRGARFDEVERIRELVSQQRARREQSVTGNGHGLAMAAACAGMSPLAKLNHQLSGLAGIRSLRELDDSLADDNNAANFARQLGAVHERIAAMPRQLLAIAEPDAVGSIAKQQASVWSEHSANTSDKFSLPQVREKRSEFWVANSQVNFCARAYPTVPVRHPDAAALTVLGGFLRNGILHRAIREQGGAYGGGASQDSGIAAFRFYSYRDPRLAETLADFDAAVLWLLQEKHEPRALEESILGVVGSLDKPSSPAGEAKQHFHNRQFGRSHEQREQFRQRILDVSLDDLRRVGDTYLKPELASTAVVSNSVQLETTAELRETLGLNVEHL
ncbi:peptidase M16 [Halieaceae bacterium IMCC8485]|jgi:Zn-dependent M16 (insulinase) family peptidase|uniref:Peptidase M16 n=1 Tax=Candidatus Seongchinamella marina TaxID=2518990 RepID=A0ABT3SSF6_9GAMM|nr:insulinase family protein [Candidatus Seongchinamella marina]MCX2972921.1 peptidase M16 [Candidatus Seongchinamella marina]